jgi:hypothetical protein
MSQFFQLHRRFRATLIVFFTTSIILLLPLAGIAKFWSTIPYGWNHNNYCYDMAVPPVGTITIEAANAGERLTVFPLGIECDFFMRDGSISTVTDYNWTDTVLCYGSLLFAATSATGLLMLRRARPARTST